MRSLTFTDTFPLGAFCFHAPTPRPRFVWFELTHPIETRKNNNSPNAICTIGTLRHRLAMASTSPSRRRIEKCCCALSGSRLLSLCSRLFSPHLTACHLPLCPRSRCHTVPASHSCQL